MTKPKQGRMRESVEQSIEIATKEGRLDPQAQAAPLEMLRYMADYLDSDTGDTPPTRYVTPASFLNYCAELGLMPDSEALPKKPKAKLTAFTSSAKFAKVKNG